MAEPAWTVTEELAYQKFKQIAYKISDALLPDELRGLGKRYLAKAFQHRWKCVQAYYIIEDVVNHKSGGPELAAEAIATSMRQAHA